ncbi:hypothetical protein [Fodinicurvata sediminis]|uniref:hypothetical protein n=1 Tax=Fodinicurvata sediminis TaxID=1121832 RepID=UPI0003B59CC5|nr:hypothetical protein [Fodinicurvata sediminis]
MTEDPFQDVRQTIQLAEAVAPPPNPGPPDSEDGGGGERRSRKGGDLPEGCPVLPLGIQGEVCWYLDAERQLRALKAKDHSRLGVQSLFGRHIAKLYDYWPRTDKDGAVTGWRPERAAESLMKEAARAGVWDVFGRVRGPGTWQDDQGHLVMHLGDAILTTGPDRGPNPDGAMHHLAQPGQVGRHVYPSAAAIPRPAHRRQPPGDTGPAAQLLTLLQSWNWRRPDCDAHLLMGWIGAAMLGGALKWRPLAWITGEAGTGKSTLHDVLQGVLADAIVSVSDPTAAGIWQKLGHASLPVAIDELENDEDNRSTYKVIKLARQAASGGVVLRGGADHHGTEFQARSCFLFSSILVPPLLTQDRSRMAILELLELDRSAPPPKVDRATMMDLGARLKRRLLDGWPRFEETLEAYRAQLTSGGHGARGSDQFGTLLAVADLMLHDHLPAGDELAVWSERLSAADIAEQDDAARDHERWLQHLLTSVVDAWRGGSKRTIGRLVEEAAEVRQYEQHGEFDYVADANDLLGNYGLRVIRKDERSWLAVANSHQGLQALFHGSQWSGRSGTAGGWVQSARRIPGARWGQGCLVRLGGAASRCTLIPIEAIVQQEDRPTEA